MTIRKVLDYLFNTEKGNTVKCTYCGGTEFYEGPSGGMSTNVLCANKACRHWFNHTPALDRFDDLNRIEPSEEEKKTAVQRAEEEKQQKLKATYEEGRAMFMARKSAAGCFEDKPYGGYALAHNNAVRLGGWLDAAFGIKSPFS